MLNILADELMPHVHDLFSSVAHITTKPGRDITAEDLMGVHILLVRSVTSVDAALLEHADDLVFVGSATIGVDHIDATYLKEQGIAFSAAPGCNAQAVAQYAFCALLTLSEQDAVVLQNKTVGIIGAGHIGSALAARLKALKMRVLLYDPLMQRQSSTPQNFCDFEQLCQESDILSFHVPLVQKGQHPTHHMLNDETLKQLKPDVWILNTSRGDVIDNDALLAWKNQHIDARLVLDVWENEPYPNQELIAKTDIATPHIAGHSIEGKVRGTYMLYQKLCALYHWLQPLEFARIAPEAKRKPITLLHHPSQQELYTLCRDVFDIEANDKAFREAMHKPKGFDTMRRNYPLRHEFSAQSFRIKESSLQKFMMQLGFSTQ